MEKIYDKEQIRYWVEREGIRESFSCGNMDFYLCRYEKGEYLTAPYRRTKELLFVVSGTIQIYGIRDDGSAAPIAQGGRPALIGDIEFTTEENPTFFAEAKTVVLCIALSMEKYRRQLESDLKFLHMLLRSYTDKLALFSFSEAAPTIEAKVLMYMENFSENHEIHGIEEAVHQLHCSRRQLQRVLAKLCETGRIQKTGRGRYKLKS